MQMSKGWMQNRTHPRPARRVTPAQAGVQNGATSRAAASWRCRCWIPGQARNDAGETEDRLFSANGHHTSRKGRV